MGNLIVDESSQSASPASEKVVDAVLKGMLQHLRYLDVQMAARVDCLICFMKKYSSGSLLFAISFFLSCSALMSLSSSAVYVALIRRNSMSIESLKLAHEWHAGDVGDIISTLRNRLDVIDVSTTNMPGRENLHNDDHRTSRLGLPTLTPRRGLGRRSFGARFSVDLGLEDGDLD